MRLRALSLIVLLAITLSGCFTSPEPLVGANNAAYPFTSLVLEDAQGAQFTINRSGDLYVYAGNEADADMLLQDYGQGLYLLQFTSHGDNPGRLYAAVRIDPTTRSVTIYRTIAQESDYATGIAKCVEDGVETDYACLTSGQQLIDIVRAAIADNEDPDESYTIISMT